MTVKTTVVMPTTLVIACLIGAAFFSPETCAAASSGKRQVYVTASFTDNKSLYIENLKADEVQILENGIPKKIELMVQEEIPTIYGLLFDRSLLEDDQSVNQRYLTGRISSAVAARDMAFDIIDKHLHQQRMWIASYDLRFHLELASTTDGFAAKDAITQMKFSHNPDGAFAYTGLYSAVMEMNECPERRRVIILFLDTLDQESTGKITQLYNLLSVSNVELIVISFASKLSSNTGVPPAMSRGALSKLVQATAGKAYFWADSGEHIEDIARPIYNQIRTFYTFGFESEAPSDIKTELLIRCTRRGSKVKHHPFTPILSSR